MIMTGKCDALLIGTACGHGETVVQVRVRHISVVWCVSGTHSSVIRVHSPLPLGPCWRFLSTKWSVLCELDEADPTNGSQDYASSFLLHHRERDSSSGRGETKVLACMHQNKRWGLCYTCTHRYCITWHCFFFSLGAYQELFIAHWCGFVYECTVDVYVYICTMYILI